MEGYRMVYKYKYMAVFRKQKKIIIRNMRQEFKYHTHVESIGVAKTICKNVVDKKFPKTRNHWLLISHIRVSDDPNYTNKIEELLDVRRNKGKKYFYNISGRERILT